MSLTCKVPKLRFGEFSGEWEEKKYGEIYSFFSTNSFSRDNLNYENGSVKNIHYGDIHTKFSTIFDIRKENVPFINNEINLSKIKEENYCLVGDLVIADASEDYADIGKTIEITNLDNKKVLAGLHTFLARPNKFDMALGYMGYSLQNWKIRKQIMTIAQGTKVLSLSTSRLANVILHLPSKPEQQKIASFLSAVDTKIDQLTRKKELLEQYKKGVMQKIFSQELRFKDDDGSEFPEWVEKKLGEIVISINNGTSLTQSNDQSGYKVTRIETISDTTINVNKIGYVSTNTDLSSYKLNIGDMLFSNINSVKHIGKIAYVDREYDLYHGMNLLNIRVNNHSTNSKFIYYLLTSKKYKNYFETICNQAVSQASINQTDLKKTKILLPSLKEQTKIANFLSSLDEKLLHVSTQLDATKQFKKALLQQMFV